MSVEVEAGEANDSKGMPTPVTILRKRRRMILPLRVLGSAGTRTMRAGTANLAIRDDTCAAVAHAHARKEGRKGRGMRHSRHRGGGGVHACTCMRFCLKA